MVFDIDISDYDPVRLCGCSGASLCQKCWSLMNCAIKVLDHLLRRDFGCRHIFFAFSGRRGIHCWVCDDSMKKLKNDGRAAVANYFHVYKGTDKNAKKVDLPKDQYPPFTWKYVDECRGSSIYPILKKYFEEIFIKSMGILEDEEKLATFLETISEGSGS